MASDAELFEDDPDVCSVCGEAPVVRTVILRPEQRGLGDGPDRLFWRQCIAHVSTSPRRRVERQSSPAREPWWMR